MAYNCMLEYNPEYKDKSKMFYGRPYLQLPMNIKDHIQALKIIASAEGASLKTNRLTYHDLWNLTENISLSPNFEEIPIITHKELAGYSPKKLKALFMFCNHAQLKKMIGVYGYSLIGDLSRIHDESPDKADAIIKALVVIEGRLNKYWPQGGTVDAVGSWYNTSPKKLDAIIKALVVIEGRLNKYWPQGGTVEVVESWYNTSPEKLEAIIKALVVIEGRLTQGVSVDAVGSWYDTSPKKLDAIAYSMESIALIGAKVATPAQIAELWDISQLISEKLNAPYNAIDNLYMMSKSGNNLSTAEYISGLRKGINIITRPAGSPNVTGNTGVPGSTPTGFAKKFSTSRSPLTSAATAEERLAEQRGKQVAEGVQGRR